MEKVRISINGDRLKNTIEQFSVFGRTINGGVTRLALSEEDRKARDYFRTCCEQLGMNVRIDDLGNMYAWLFGTNSENPPIVIGSHLDSVKKGGRFDGVLGVAGGLEVVHTLVENDIKPQVPIVIANFTNEEGARFEPSMMASGILSGKFEKSIMMKQKDSEGITVEDALNRIGYVGEKVNRLKKATAFIELHIEQGPVLEEEFLSIGVVEGVVGMICYEVEVCGVSNHAGTTPMSNRKDALFSTFNIVMEAREKLNQLSEGLVYTIGRMNVFPNIHTVIPEKVVFTFEARHRDPEIIMQVEKVIKSLTVCENREGCEVKVRKLWDRDTVWFDDNVVRVIEESANSLGLSYKKMMSGAGHDAQFIANYIPTGMIFVPSVNGKSHCEEELTAWEDCERGVNVLLETVLKLS